MNTNALPRIVRLTSLKSFLAEVPVNPAEDGPKPLLRLLNRHTEFQMSATLLLSLQGVNAHNEIVWLCEAHTISWLHDRPFGKVAESAYLAMRELETIVRGYLESQGYEVRSGDYGLPDIIKPLSADFECAKWVRVSEQEWTVKAVDLSVAAMAT